MNGQGRYQKIDPVLRTISGAEAYTLTTGGPSNIWIKIDLGRYKHQGLGSLVRRMA